MKARGPLRALFLLLLSPLPAFAATTITSYTISGSPIGGSVQNATATVTISRDPADTGAIGVSPSGFWSSSLFSCPNGCFVPAGSSSMSFNLWGPPVATATSFNVTVQCNCGTGGVLTATSSFIVQPFQITFSISPGAVYGGSTDVATGKISVNAAVKGDANFSRSSTAGLISYLDASVIPDGGASVSFRFQENNVTATTVDTVTVTYGASVSAKVTINPFALTSFTISPTSLVGGSSQQGTATFTFNATLASRVQATCGPGTLLTPYRRCLEPTALRRATPALAMQSPQVF